MTYSGVSIGTAASDRIVVVCFASTLSRVSSITIDSGGGAVAMTLGAGNSGASDNVYARMAYLLVTSGTTATIVITTVTGSPSAIQNHVCVYAVTGIGTAPAVRTSSDYQADMSTGSAFMDAPISAGGAFIGVSGSAPANAKSWSNATEDLDEKSGSGGFQFGTATRNTAFQGHVSLTDGTNVDSSAVSSITFLVPLAFGDMVGSSGRANQSSITNPFTPTSAIAISVGDIVIVVVEEAKSGSGTSTACSDNLGNTYSSLTGGSSTSTSTVVAFFTVATVGGSCTPSVTTTASANGAVIVCAAFKGNGSKDINLAVASDTTSPYSATATGVLAQADELIIGYFGNATADNYTTANPTGAYLPVGLSTSGSVASACITAILVAVTTSVTMTVTGDAGGSGHNCVCGTVTFKKQTTVDFPMSPAADALALAGVVPTLAYLFQPGLFLADYVLDNGLNVLDTQATHIHICSSNPILYSDVATLTLGNKNFGAGNCFGVPAGASPNGRKVSSTPIIDGSITASGTATFIAVTDQTNSRLLAVIKLSSPTAVTNGLTFVLASFDISEPDS